MNFVTWTDIISITESTLGSYQIQNSRKEAVSTWLADVVDHDIKLEMEQHKLKVVHLCF